MLIKIVFLILLWKFFPHSICKELISCQTRSGQRGYCSRVVDCSAIVGQVLFLDTLEDRNCREMENAICCPGAPDSVKQQRLSSAPILLSDYVNDFEDRLNSVGVEMLRSQPCGKPFPDRIANGEAAILNEFPWLALLRYGERFLCGGSLISDRWVLTAAHCITASLTSVRLGEYDISKVNDCKRQVGRRRPRCFQAQDFGIEHSLRHPNFTSNGHVKDIALIQLNATVIFQENIRPVCLPTRLQHLSLPLTNDIISLDQHNAEYHGSLDSMPITAGWGTTETGHTADVLQKARLFSLTNDLCAKVYQRTFTGNSKMCVGIASNVSTCRGDSGGPLFWQAPYFTAEGGSVYHRYVQIGLTSLGLMSCGKTSGMPALFENVAISMDWITAVIAN